MYEPRRYSCTASSGTRKLRPTRTAGSSPLCTRRYTVIFETRIVAATSATVRNCTRERSPSSLRPGAAVCGMVDRLPSTRRAAGLPLRGFDTPGRMGDEGEGWDGEIARRDGAVAVALGASSAPAARPPHREIT